MKLFDFFKRKPLERLEVYMLAADNPIGRRQLRPIFKRKRGKEVLTREQVQAIKTARKLLRKEMKEQGLTRREDFENTAKSLNLYFDGRGGLLPIILWFARGNTAAKVLATTALLTTTVPVVEYVTKTVYETITQEVQVEVEVEVDKPDIDVSAGAVDEGFSLDINNSFENASSHLQCPPALDVPPISFRDIPANVDTVMDGAHHDNYFAYTFYCRYENEQAKILLDQNPGADVSHLTTDYDWTLELNVESMAMSDAVWVMVFEDGEMTYYAKPNAAGETETLPDVADNTRGYPGYTLGHLEEVAAGVTCDHPDHENLAGLMQTTKDPLAQYQEIFTRDDHAYYRLLPQNYVGGRIVAQGGQTGVEHNEIHKYTVVMWLEGDDPECTNDKMGGHIGMEFHIQLKGEALPEDPAPGEEEPPAA